jgi:hypothetical protein
LPKEAEAEQKCKKKRIALKNTEKPIQMARHSQWDKPLGDKPGAM